MNQYFTYLNDEIKRYKEIDLNDMELFCNSTIKFLIKSSATNALMDLQLTKDNNEIILYHAFTSFVLYLYDYGKFLFEESDNNNYNEDDLLKVCLYNTFDLLNAVEEDKELLKDIVNDMCLLKTDFLKMYNNSTGIKVNEMFIKFNEFCFNNKIHPIVLLGMFSGLEKEIEEKGTFNN